MVVHADVTTEYQWKLLIRRANIVLYSVYYLKRVNISELLVRRNAVHPPTTEIYCEDIDADHILFWENLQTAPSFCGKAGI